MKLAHFRLSRFFIRVVSFLHKHFFLILAIIALSILTLFGFKGFNLLSRLKVKPENLLGFFGTPVKNVDNTAGVTNFLILGIRGEGTDSPNLADTIIVFSYDHNTKVTSMISVPRDLWVPSHQAKINSAYYYGFNKDSSPSAGIRMAEGAIQEDLGLPIHYTAVINFTIFKETIDLVGGIDVDINAGFTDTRFPILGKENAEPESSRYETITFATGSAHMNGDTALKFVRSRHSIGEEGTDFARSRRQQQVISALKQKILAPSFLLNEKNIENLISILNRNLITNLDSNLYPTLAKIALDTQGKDIKSISLSDLPDKNGITILYNPPQKQYKGEWVLMPKDNNWPALKKYLSNQINNAQ